MEFKNPELALEKIFHNSVLKTIKPGVLTVSAYANFFPVCYKEKGVLKGLDVEIMKEFARLCNLKIKFIEKKNFDGIWLDPVKRPKISDVAIGGIGITKKRTRADTEWTIPYFYVNRTLIYNKKDPLISLKDVDRTVLGTKNSTGWIDAFERLKKLKLSHHLKPGTTDENDLKLLLEGKIQGLMRGSFVGKAIVKKYPQLGMITPWKMDPSLVSSDGEVFAYPCNVRSRVGLLLSVFLTEEIMNHHLVKIIKKYGLY